MLQSLHNYEAGRPLRLSMSMASPKDTQEMETALHTSVVYHLILFGHDELDDNPAGSRRSIVTLSLLSRESSPK